MSAIIYRITNTVNGKFYIGQTSKGLEKRWRQHCYTASTEPVQYFHRAIRKYGIDAFATQTIETIENSSSEYIDARERYWIAEYKSNEPQFGYNMTVGGDGLKGYTHSPETKQKLKEIHSGRILSDEHRAKIAESMRGKKRTLETRKRISESKSGRNNPMYGKTLTTETRRKLSIAMAQRKLSEIHRKKIGNAHKNKIITDEQRKKISESLKAYHKRNQLSLGDGQSGREDEM